MALANALDQVKGWAQIRPTQPISFELPWKTGRFYTHPDAATLTTGTTAGTAMLAVPIYVPNTAGVTITSIGVEVTSASTGGSMRLGIYQPLANGTPGKLVIDGSTVVTTGTGFKSVTVSQLLPMGWWYLASCHSTTSTFPQLRVFSTTAILPNNRMGVDSNPLAVTPGFWFTVAAFTTVDPCNAIVANGLPGYWPQWTRAVVPTGGTLDRIMVGI